MDYENYRHVCHKWHYKIAKALVVCLESKDFVQIRNALTVLTKILPHFPVIVNLSVVIEKRIDKVFKQILATINYYWVQTRQNQVLKYYLPIFQYRYALMKKSKEKTCISKLPVIVGSSKQEKVKCLKKVNFTLLKKHHPHRRQNLPQQKR